MTLFAKKILDFQTSRAEVTSFMFLEQHTWVLVFRTNDGTIFIFFSSNKDKRNITIQILKRMQNLTPDQKVPESQIVYLTDAHKNVIL